MCLEQILWPCIASYGSIIWRIVALCCPILTYIALYCLISPYIALYCNISHYIALYRIYRIISHYIALYRIISPYIAFSRGHRSKFIWSCSKYSRPRTLAKCGLIKSAKNLHRIYWNIISRKSGAFFAMKSQPTVK